jgi:hypothetical protein
LAVWIEVGKTVLLTNAVLVTVLLPRPSVAAGWSVILYISEVVIMTTAVLSRAEEDSSPPGGTEVTARTEVWIVMPDGSTVLGFSPPDMVLAETDSEAVASAFMTMGGWSHGAVSTMVVIPRPGLVPVGVTMGRTRVTWVMVPKSDLVVVGVTMGKVMKVWLTTEVVAAQRNAKSLMGAIVVGRIEKLSMCLWLTCWCVCE